MGILSMPVVLGAALLALVFAAVQRMWVAKQDAGTDRMKIIGGYIADGAMAFLGREYRVLAIFVVVVAGLLAVSNSGRSDSHVLIALAFVVGALCSAAAGFVGMRVATMANIRTTAAARESLNGALKVAFAGGSVMGLSVVGLGLAGIGGLYLLFTQVGLLGDADGETVLMESLEGGTVAACAVRRGRLLLFPHAMPHRGAEAGEPKRLLRGESF